MAGDTVQFSVSSSNQARLALDAEALAAGTLVWAVDANNPVLGPVYCLPDVSYMGTSHPTFTFQGTAPSSTGCLAGLLPNLSEDLGSVSPRPLHLVFPTMLMEVALRNISVNDLLVSLGVSQPMQTLAAGGTFSLTSGNARVKEIILACPDVGGAEFTLHGSGMLGGF
jgi:hypothetical protein